MSRRPQRLRSRLIWFAAGAGLNYNFRTEASGRTILTRYLSAVLLLWLLSSAMLTALKHVDAHLALNIGDTALDLDIVGTQCFLSGLKFLLYHKWVFPLAKTA